MKTIQQTKTGMKKFILGLIVFSGLALCAQAKEERKLSINDFRDHLKGAWIGKMAGVGWGTPTELKVCGRIMKESELPPWDPKMVNQYENDDCYVEQGFVRTLELHGLDVSAKQAGMDFANTKFSLFCANFIGRNNVRCGIMPPDSGHPKCAIGEDLLDFRIESDFAGLISPGLPNSVIALDDKFGHMMNYGDGVYSGQFLGGMYAEAYFEQDLIKVIEAGLKCIPEQSQYAEMVRDVLGWWRQDKVNWQKTWELVEEKYHKNEQYSHHDGLKEKTIEVKLNDAFMLMGLLYGEKDFEKTIVIATRCGQDSDCNPSSAAGVLGAILGFTAVPERFKSGLDEKRRFAASTYDWQEMLRVHEKLARLVVVKYGGRIVQGANGLEEFVIPVQVAQPGPLEQSPNPRPITGMKYSEKEIDQMIGPIEYFAPGWKVKDCLHYVDLAKRYMDRENVLQTHPLNEYTPCILYKKLTLPAGKSFLNFAVGHNPNADWDLLVKLNGKELLRKTVDAKTAPTGWMDVEVDLTPYAGKSVKLELWNQALGWSDEYAGWQNVAIGRGVNLCKVGKESRSRQGDHKGSINDGNFDTFVVTYDGLPAKEDWYAVSLDEAVTIRTVVFGHGKTCPDGGWFDTSDGKPKVQVQLTKDGDWKTVGELSDYPKTTAWTNGVQTGGPQVMNPVTGQMVASEDKGGMTNGQAFTCELAKPVKVFGLRVTGKPASGLNPLAAFSSCAELQAF